RCPRGARALRGGAPSRARAPPARNASVVRGTTPERSTTSFSTTAPMRAGPASLNVTRRIAIPLSSGAALARRQVDVRERSPGGLARLGRGQADQAQHGGGQLGIGIGTERAAELGPHHTEHRPPDDVVQQADGGFREPPRLDAGGGGTS